MDQDPSKRPRRRIRIAFAAVAPLAIYVGPPAVFAGFAHDPNWADFWKTAATPYGTMTAGFAAIAAAGIAYANGKAQRETDRDTAHQELTHAQKQLAATTDDADRKHDAEIVRDLRTRFTTATQQLADPTHTIQQAGAYALASLADDWLQRKNTQEAQVCINVLCTYLRTHHLGEGTTSPDEPPADQPVRDTIVRIIAEHLRVGRKHVWSSLEFDFSDTHFYNADFSYCRFAGDRISFDRVTFTGKVAWFEAATFASRTTSFDCASFASEENRFVGATFASTNTFLSHIAFAGENTVFTRAKFSGESSWFVGSTFASRITSFAWVSFANETTWFVGATFAKLADFRKPLAWEDVRFNWDHDLSSKPKNVLPDEWPPQVVTADEPDTE